MLHFCLSPYQYQVTCLKFTLKVSTWCCVMRDISKYVLFSFKDELFWCYLRILTKVYSLNMLVAKLSCASVVSSSLIIACSSLWKTNLCMCLFCPLVSKLNWNQTNVEVFTICHIAWIPHLWTILLIYIMYINTGWTYRSKWLSPAPLALPTGVVPCLVVAPLVCPNELQQYHCHEVFWSFHSPHWKSQHNRCHQPFNSAVENRYPLWRATLKDFFFLKPTFDCWAFFKLWF